MTAALIDARPRQRRPPFFDHIPQTRKVKGSKYQLRWWLRGWGSLNCGLYDRELLIVARRKLARETQHHPDTPLGLWRALCLVLGELRAVGADAPEWVGPLYVYRHKGGTGFGARMRRAGRLVELRGPFETAERAHEAMVAHLRVVFPGWNRLHGHKVLEPRRPPGRPESDTGCGGVTVTA